MGGCSVKGERQCWRTTASNKRRTFRGSGLTRYGDAWLIVKFLLECDLVIVRMASGAEQFEKFDDQDVVLQLEVDIFGSKLL